MSGSFSAQSRATRVLQRPLDRGAAAAPYSLAKAISRRSDVIAAVDKALRTPEVP